MENSYEQDNRVSQLSLKINELMGKIQQLESRVSELTGINGKLDTFIDQQSRDTINSVIRENCKRVPVIVSAGFSLQPYSEYLVVSSSASRTSSTTMAITNGTYVGQRILIEGTDNTNTIIIKDTANTQLAGDATLGIYDTLLVVWNGIYWIEISRSNN